MFCCESFWQGPAQTKPTDSMRASLKLQAVLTGPASWYLLYYIWCSGNEHLVSQLQGHRRMPRTEANPYYQTATCWNSALGMICWKCQCMAGVWSPYRPLTVPTPNMWPSRLEHGEHKNVERRWPVWWVTVCFTSCTQLTACAQASRACLDNLTHWERLC